MAYNSSNIENTLNVGESYLIKSLLNILQGL